MTIYWDTHLEVGWRTTRHQGRDLPKPPGAAALAGDNILDIAVIDPPAKPGIPPDRSPWIHPSANTMGRFRHGHAGAQYIYSNLNNHELDIRDA